MRLRPGQIIQPSYSHRRHKVLKVTTGCTCPRFSDEMGTTNTGCEKVSPPHIHISCKDLADGQKSWFNYYAEDLSHLWDSDYIRIVQDAEFYKLFN